MSGLTSRWDMCAVLACSRHSNSTQRALLGSIESSKAFAAAMRADVTSVFCKDSHQNDLDNKAATKVGCV